jgi:hypothetical protein
MRNHSTVTTVVSVPVVDPVTRANVYLHVPAHPSALWPYIEHCIEEVGAGLEIPAAGVDHCHVFPAHGFQGRTPGFVIPYALEMAFRVGERMPRRASLSNRPVRIYE